MALYTVAAHFVVDKSVTAAFLKEAVSIGCANLILGLLLVFRTNSAYERWSEGRRLWGQLMNESRSLSLKVSHYLKIPDQEKDQFGELIVSYAFALKHHLRDSTPSTNLPGIKPMSELGAAHVPVHVTDTMYAIMNVWYQKSFIDSHHSGLSYSPPLGVHGYRRRVRAHQKHSTCDVLSRIHQTRHCSKPSHIATLLSVSTTSNAFGTN